MSSAANKAKTKWNSQNYTQVKFSVSPELAAQFKSACADNGVSMASVLTHFIAEYVQVACPVKTSEPDYLSTKRKRRKGIDNVFHKLEQIRDAQELAKDNIPDNLQGHDTYEEAERSIEVMENVLELLGEIY